MSLISLFNAEFKRFEAVSDYSGVDPEGARGAIAPSIKIYQGESIFSPPQSFSLFFHFSVYRPCRVNSCLLLQQEYAYRARQPEAYSIAVHVASIHRAVLRITSDF